MQIGGRQGRLLNLVAPQYQMFGLPQLQPIKRLSDNQVSGNAKGLKPSSSASTWHPLDNIAIQPLNPPQAWESACLDSTELRLQTCLFIAIAHRRRQQVFTMKLCQLFLLFILFNFYYFFFGTYAFCAVKAWLTLRTSFERGLKERKNLHIINI